MSLFRAIRNRPTKTGHTYVGAELFAKFDCSTSDDLSCSETSCGIKPKFGPGLEFLRLQEHFLQSSQPLTASFALAQILPKWILFEPLLCSLSCSLPSWHSPSRLPRVQQPQFRRQSPRLRRSAARMARPLYIRQIARWELLHRTALDRSPPSSARRGTSPRFGTQVIAWSSRPVFPLMRPGSRLSARMGQFLGQPRPCMKAPWREDSRLLSVVSPFRSIFLLQFVQH